MGSAPAIRANSRLDSGLGIRVRRRFPLDKRQKPSSAFPCKDLGWRAMTVPKMVQREMGRYKCSLSLVGKDCAAKENHDGHRLQGSMLQPAKWMEECWVVVSGVAIARRTPGGRRKGPNWRLRAHVCGHEVTSTFHRA